MHAPWRIHLARETVLVGQALNYTIEPIGGFDADTWAKANEGEVFEEIDASLQGRKGRVNWHSSMAQDVKKGRRSEIDYIERLRGAERTGSRHPHACKRRRHHRHARN